MLTVKVLGYAYQYILERAFIITANLHSLFALWRLVNNGIILGQFEQAIQEDEYSYNISSYGYLDK